MYVCIDVYGFLDNNDSTCFFVYSIMTFLILYITLYKNIYKNTQIQSAKKPNFPPNVKSLTRLTRIVKSTHAYIFTIKPQLLHHTIA